MLFKDFAKKYSLEILRGFSFFEGEGSHDLLLFTYPDVVRRRSLISGSVVCSNAELWDKLNKSRSDYERRVFNSPNYRVLNRLRMASFFWYKYIGIDYSRLSFFTLTTVQHKTKHTDKFLTSVLNKFLTYLRKYFDLKTYIWVVERQYNSGNLLQCTEDLHFHIVADVGKLDIKKCVSLWAKYLGVEPHPALFDVKKVNLNDWHHLSSYLFKYMLKTELSNIVTPVYTSRVCGWSRDIKINDKSKFYEFVESVPTGYVPVVSNSFCVVYVPPKS